MGAFLFMSNGYSERFNSQFGIERNLSSLCILSAFFFQVRTSPLSLSQPVLGDFPPGIWAKRLPRQAVKKKTSNILKLMDQSVNVVEDELPPGKAVNVIALTINHVKEGDSEDSYTQEELVSALQEQVSLCC